MSGRTCSVAWRVFFEGDLVTLVEAPDRGYAYLHLPFAPQPRADLVQRQIRPPGYEVEQPPLVVLERRATVTCSRFGINTNGGCDAFAKLGELHIVESCTLRRHFGGGTALASVAGLQNQASCTTQVCGALAKALRYQCTTQETPRQRPRQAHGTRR